MFRVILAQIPPSVNATGEAKDRYKKKIAPWLEAIDFPVFGGDDRLYGGIIYFNHGPTNVRDVHNIFKPTFDLLQGRVYTDDKAIVYFEGVRLDMAVCMHLFLSTWSKQ